MASDSPYCIAKWNMYRAFELMGSPDFFLNDQYRANRMSVVSNFRNNDFETLFGIFLCANLPILHRHQTIKSYHTDRVAQIWSHESHHWNGNVILMKFSSLAALKVVKMPTVSAASYENFVKMTFFVSVMYAIHVRIFAQSCQYDSYWWSCNIHIEIKQSVFTRSGEVVNRSVSWLFTGLFSLSDITLWSRVDCV